MGATRFEGMLNESKWPEYDQIRFREDVIEMPVQVNGKVRGVIEISPDATRRWLGKSQRK